MKHTQNDAKTMVTDYCNFLIPSGFLKWWFLKFLDKFLHLGRLQLLERPCGACKTSLLIFPKYLGALLLCFGALNRIVQASSKFCFITDPMESFNLRFHIPLKVCLGRCDG